MLFTGGSTPSDQWPPILDPKSDEWLLGEIAALRERCAPAFRTDANEIMAPHASSPRLQCEAADALRNIVGFRPAATCLAERVPPVAGVGQVPQ